LETLSLKQTKAPNFHNYQTEKRKPIKQKEDKTKKTTQTRDKFNKNPTNIKQKQEGSKQEKRTHKDKTKIQSLTVKKIIIISFVAQIQIHKR
jgi:hypothetical protein